MNYEESLEAEIVELKKEIEFLLSGYKRILESSDSEMRDGDFARGVAVDSLKVK